MLHKFPSAHLVPPWRRHDQFVQIHFPFSSFLIPSHVLQKRGKKVQHCLRKLSPERPLLPLFQDNFPAVFQCFQKILPDLRNGMIPAHPNAVFKMKVNERKSIFTVPTIAVSSSQTIFLAWIKPGAYS